MHREVQTHAESLSEHLMPKSRAYHEIWLDGEKVESSKTEAEPIYGDTYLPRKFKIGIALPEVPGPLIAMMLLLATNFAYCKRIPQQSTQCASRLIADSLLLPVLTRRSFCGKLPLAHSVSAGLPAV